MLRRAGLQEVSQRNAVLALTGHHPYKRLPMQFAASLRKRIIAGGILTEAQLDACLSDVAAIANDPGAVMTTFIVTQVAGKRQADDPAATSWDGHFRDQS